MSFNNATSSVNVLLNALVIEIATPSGDVAPELLVAAKKAGVGAVYKMGSAWAIAAATPHST